MGRAAEEYWSCEWLLYEEMSVGKFLVQLYFTQITEVQNPV